MAHSNKKTGEHRRHPEAWPRGTKIGMMTPAGMAKGTVGSMDDGGWIYPNWDVTLGQKLPSYCRSTQVIKLGDKT